MTTQANNDKAIIKKYANRRLYNTQTSCYITLDDVFDMIKRGEDFEVQDARTGEDLTRSILTQIIFEQEAKGYNLLPVSFLKQLISLYGKKIENMDFLFPKYLEVTMDNFFRNQERLRQFSSTGWQEFTPVKIFENTAQRNIDMFINAMEMFKPPVEKK